MACWTHPPRRDEKIKRFALVIDGASASREDCVKRADSQTSCKIPGDDEGRRLNEIGFIG